MEHKLTYTIPDEIEPLIPDFQRQRIAKLVSNVIQELVLESLLHTYEHEIKKAIKVEDEKPT